jgi:transcriptional regulator with XRE-family HTH domain
MNIAMRTKIKTLREGKGFSQSQMAEKLHMDERNYKRIESGEKKMMDTEMLMRIAEVLDVDAAELLVNETINIENNDIHDNRGSAIVAYEINNGAAKETTELIQQMKEIIEANRNLVADNNRLIAMLLEKQGKV